jgi:hypothetical protein
MIKMLKNLQVRGRLFCIVLLLSLFAACGGEPQGGSEEATVTVHRVALGVDEFFDLTWLPDGWLVLNRSAGLDDTLWRSRPDGSHLGRLPIPNDPRCRRLNQLRPRTLPNGNLGFLSWCDLSGASDETDLSLEEFDLERKEQRPLMARSLGWNPSTFTWNPDMTRGLFSVTSGICAGIGAMTRQRVVDSPLAIVVDGRPRRLSEDLYEPASAGCSGNLKADLPAWSPDGSRIAFLASPEAIGIGGFERLDAPWDLYLVGAEEEARAVPVLSDLVEPRDLEWSPDGGSLAYAGKMAGSGEGVWTFVLATRQLRRLVAGTYFALAWSPDGTQIGVIRDVGPIGAQPPHTEVLVLDLRGTSRSSR